MPNEFDDLASVPPGAEELLDELDLGSARGGRRPAAPVSVTVVRALTEADLPRLEEKPQVPGVQLAALKSSHHQLAQLIAKGNSQASACLITGYSETYVSRLVNEDPAFQGLVSHYCQERELVFVDCLERMKTLGLEVNDLLLARIREEPERWTNQQLADLHKETIGKLVAGGPASGGPGVQIGKLEVSFVTPGPREAYGPGVVIDQPPAQEVQE